MGSVFRRKGRDGTPLRNYSIAFHDATGKRVTKSAGTSDKRAARRILAEVEARVALIGSGAVDPLQERYGEQARIPIRTHLEDYLAACGEKQAAHGLRQKVRHLEWLLEETGATRLSDILPDVVDARLRALAEKGAAARTLNLKLECANAFLNWCVRNGRLQANPLRVVSRRNEALDRRRVRRALTDDETRSLMATVRATAANNRQARMRPLWYLFCLLAGFRRGDLERLRWGRYRPPMGGR